MWALEVLSRGRMLYIEAAQLNGENEPLFCLYQERKFEFSELSSIIMGKFAKGIFTVLLIFVGFVFIFCGIVPSSQSLSVNIPVNTSVFRTCNSSEFDTGIIPSGRCLNWYRLMVSLFGVVGTISACLRAKEQKYMNIIFALARFTVMCYVVCFAIYVIVMCKDKAQENLITKFEFHQGMLAFATFFNFVSLPIFLPALSHLVAKKSIIVPVLVTSCVIVLLQCIIFSVVLVTAFGKDIHQNSLLNLQPYTVGNYSITVKVISHLVILYPCFDGICSFMFGVILASNQTFTILTGKDYTEFSNKMGYRVLNFSIYIFYSLSTTILALFVSNLAIIISLAGSIFFICNVLFPSLLNIVSSQKCRKLVASENTSLLTRVSRFLFKSAFPTSFSGFYSGCLFIAITTAISAILFTISFYYLTITLFS
ncbi:hypothetical protein LOD99_8671 [Oopsacas minuta]|uniref:Transmembrane protein n=1 Tax=Oopsacas minuta TaxID=111878 RepID=A0AAV7JFI3_9METZ|nr:hypothetical protein LOD99_8671 [Oopsacas minuta]